MIVFVNHGEPVNGRSSMLEQALTHKSAEIGQAVGYAGCILV
jgi:hypothetical protein